MRTVTHGLSAATVAALVFAGPTIGAVVPTDVVNVDFNTTNLANVTGGTVSIVPSGTYVGTAAGPATAGNYFNGVVLGNKELRPDGQKVFHNFTSGPLLASDGATTTGITLSLTNINQYDNTDVQVPAPLTALLDDYAYSQPVAGTPTFTIHGLNPASTYNLYLYSQNGSTNNDNEITTFTIGGSAKTATNAHSSVGTLTLNVNYVLFTGLQSNPAGDISGSFTSTSAVDFFQPVLNGFQLVQTSVPEPASLTLLVLACPVLLRRRPIRETSFGRHIGRAK